MFDRNRWTDPKGKDHGGLMLDQQEIDDSPMGPESSAEEMFAQGQDGSIVVSAVVEWAKRQC